MLTNLLSGGNAYTTDTLRQEDATTIACDITIPYKVASPSDGAAMLDLILLHLDYSDFRPKTSLGICHCYQLSNIHLLITHDFKSDTTATF